MTASEEYPPLGLHSKENSLTTHDTMGEHASKSWGDWQRYQQIADSTGFMLHSKDRNTYLSGKGGFFFRVEPNDPNSELLHGFTAVRDFESNNVVIDSWYTQNAGEVIDDAVHFLWLRRAIPTFALTAMGFMKVGAGVKEAIFGVDIDEPAARLLESFGVQQPDGRWTTPFAVTIDPPTHLLDRFLEAKPASHSNFAVRDARSNNETTTHFTHNGERIGRLLIARGTGERVLLDTGRQEVPLTIPDVVADTHMDEMLHDPQVVNTLALTSLLHQI